MIRFGTDLLFTPNQFSSEEEGQIRRFFEEKQLTGFDGTITELYRFPEAEPSTDVFISVERRQRFISNEIDQAEQVETFMNNLPEASAVVPIADFTPETTNSQLLDLVGEIRRILASRKK